MQIIKETGGSRYIYIHIYQNELNKVCFQHVMAYGHFRDIPILCDRAFNITKNPNYDG